MLIWGEVYRLKRINWYETWDDNMRLDSYSYLSTLMVMTIIQDKSNDEKFNLRIHWSLLKSILIEY